MTDYELTPDQARLEGEFRAFADEQVLPIADAIDENAAVPERLLASMSERGYFGALVPEEYSGRPFDMIAFGLLNAHFGRASASLLSILTVHTMVTQSLLRFGSSDQKRRWLPALARGQCFGAFALSEPHVGSDAKSVQARAERHADGFAVHAHKKWVSFGQRAALFLTLARCDRGLTAFLVERCADGVEVQPISGLLGFRGAMAAELRLSGCPVSPQQVLGPIGAGWNFVANAALAHGRFCIAWGCAGLCRASFDASVRYACHREQFGSKLREHQLIAAMIADMATSVRAADLLCLRAARLRQAEDPAWVLETGVAKYFASRAALTAASDAVQIHGANGCSSEYPVQRYFRDAKIMEIIEGTTQLQQLLIADHSCRLVGELTRQNHE